jgi:hypothetical protein
MIQDAIINNSRAWISAGQLTKRFGGAAVEDMERAGLIVRWALDRTGQSLRRQSYTLTPQGAYCFGVVIAETEGELGMGVPYWTKQYADVPPRRGGRLLTPSRPPIPVSRRARKWLRDENGELVKILGQSVAEDPRLTCTKMGKRGRKQG